MKQGGPGKNGRAPPAFRIQVHYRGSRMIRVLVIGICLVVSAFTALASSASTKQKSYFVTATVPSPATIESFVNGRFKETVTCRAACRVQTEVLIRASVARRLGFQNVKGKLFLIATSKARLEAKRPTKLRLVMTSEVKSRLRKAKSPVSLFASVQAFPTKRPGVNYSVAWTSLLLTRA